MSDYETVSVEWLDTTESSPYWRVVFRLGDNHYSQYLNAPDELGAMLEVKKQWDQRNHKP